MYKPIIIPIQQEKFNYILLCIWYHAFDITYTNLPGSRV